MVDLDDTSKTCIYIPPVQVFGEEEDLVDSQDDVKEVEARMKAYKVAWMKCLDRVRDILQKLNGPVVETVVEHVQGAYEDILPGLPYPELPVVALCGANSALMSSISRKLRSIENIENGEEDSRNHLVLQVHLHPADCSNVMNMMKALVTGFVDLELGPRRKPTSLASFDINLLRAWYAAHANQPRLVVFLHEFEKFGASVVQDVFYICSLHVAQLPLVFVLDMSSPPSPSFLHSTYTRSTLALLHVHQFAAPTGLTTVQEVLTKVFFDPDFEPDIMLGPGMLEYIVDFAGRHTASPDAVVTMLQLAHMKHFSNPLSVFVHNELVGAHSSREAEHNSPSLPSRSIPDAMYARLLALPKTDQHLEDAHELLAFVGSARTAFHKRARRIRVAFAIARIAERIALGEATSAKGAQGRTSRMDNLETLGALLRGRVGSQVRYVCMAVRKISAAKLHALLEALHAFLYGLNSVAVRADEADARIWIVETMNKLPENIAPDHSDDPTPQNAEIKELAGSVGDWLLQYIEERLVRLEDCALWDIWYTGASPFPSELINPAPRPTIVAALLHPDDFVRSYAELTRAGSSIEDPGEAREMELWELPDTSIAFRRYIEAGRMVNVFDWFESFAVVLESQRKHLRRQEKLKEAQVNGKGKAKANGTPATPRRGDKSDADTEAQARANEDEDEEEDEEEVEKWKVEVQARFIRALHELDFMGFVRHTGRKPDHVIRTVYDVPEP